LPERVWRETALSNGAGSLNWQEIDCVLLDMDGTLLDLNYDNRVWNELVPQAYASKAGIPLVQAQQTLLAHMKEIRGTIEFYNFDYWIAFTGIDLVAVHQQATDLVAYRPGALAFLRWLKTTGRTSILATNAHPDSVRVKDANVNICVEVDAVVSSHEYGAPKEADEFWLALFKAHAHDLERCLFIDDNEPVLDAARRCGIGHLLAVATPDSARPRRTQLRYPSFDDFAEIVPELVADV
jgi:HAD superfamily hydrolase (TIGR01509 family)